MPQRYEILVGFLVLTVISVFIRRELRYFDPLGMHDLAHRWRRQNERR